MNRRQVSAFLVAAASVVAACGDGDDGSTSLDPATTVVVYEYHDSSVPPEYHRSYTLTADGGSAHLVVDSYGDVLHDVTEPLDDTLWQQLVADAAELDVSDDDRDDGCAGGTSRSISVSDDGDVAIDAWIDACVGGGDVDEVDALAAPVLALFDLDTLLAPAE